MSIAQRLYEGVDTPDGHVGLITYMRTDSTAMAGVAMGEARDVIAERYGEPFTMPKGRVYKTKSKGAQEAHESIRPTSFRRDPDSLAGTLKPEELRLYRLIWQRALASQMAPKELETTTVELADGPYELRATSTRTLFEGFARVYTEGRDDDDAEDEEAEARRLPALAEGDRTDVRDVTPDPALHRAAAALHRGDADQGARGARHRPAVDVRGDDLDDRRPRLRPGRGAPPPSRARRGIVTDLLVEHFGDYVDLAFTARMEEELDEVARGERAWVPLLQAFYAPLRDRVDEKRSELRRSDFTTEETDEVCSEGHPMVIRLGRNGRFLACSMYPEHKETRPLPGEEPPPQEGTGEVCPKCGEGTLVGKRGRFGPFVGCSRYPDCEYIKQDGPPPPEPLPFEVTCPKNNDGHLVPRRARRTGNVFWGCSNYPKCDFTTNYEPLGGAARRRRRAAGAQGRGGHLPEVRLDQRRPRRTTSSRRALPGGPPDPEALARPARAAPGGASGGRGRRAAAARLGRGDAPDRAGRRGVSAVAGRPADPRALERFLRSLAARDASPHTHRAYARRSAPTSTGWPSAASTGGGRRARSCAPTSPELGSTGSPTTVAQRLAAIRSFHRWAAREGLAPGDPWGAIATPRLPRRLPRVLEVEQVERLLAVIDARLVPPRPSRPGGTARRAPSRCATGPSSRPPMPPGCASASWPPPTSARSTCGAARSASWARAARSGSGCWAGRRSRR